jgi:hypothetical protein
MSADPVQLLMEEGLSEKKARRIAAKKNAWQIRKNVLEHPRKKVPKWRCPVHGTLLDINICVECRADADRKMELLRKRS